MFLRPVAITSRIKVVASGSPRIRAEKDRAESGKTGGKIEFSPGDDYSVRRDASFVCKRPSLDTNLARRFDITGHCLATVRTNAFSLFRERERGESAG